VTERETADESAAALMEERNRLSNIWCMLKHKVEQQQHQSKIEEKKPFTLYLSGWPRKTLKWTIKRMYMFNLTCDTRSHPILH
jgi:hypothetical protein